MPGFLDASSSPYRQGLYKNLRVQRDRSMRPRAPSSHGSCLLVPWNTWTEM